MQKAALHPQATVENKLMTRIWAVLVDNAASPQPWQSSKVGRLREFAHCQDLSTDELPVIGLRVKQLPCPGHTRLMFAHDDRRLPDADARVPLGSAHHERRIRRPRHSAPTALSEEDRAAPHDTSRSDRGPSKVPPAIGHPPVKQGARLQQPAWRTPPYLWSTIRVNIPAV